MKRITIVLGFVVVLGGLQIPAAGQAIPNQVLALYPQQAGEVVFVDVRALRNSPHYPKLKAQVLPERFRQLEQWVQILGIDFDREVQQLSWGFVGGPEGQAVELLGVAEGAFDLREVERGAQRNALTPTRYARYLVVSLGKNQEGREFIFAFADQSTAIFGFRAAVQEMLDRHAQGGPSLLNNATLRNLVNEVNGRAPLWLVLDSQFTTVALKQMLPEVSRVPGFETLAGRLETTALRFELKEGMRGNAAVRCASGADALLFSTIVQLALSYQTSRLSETNPELARVLNDLRLNRQEERLDLELAIREPDFITLLEKNSFALNF